MSAHAQSNGALAPSVEVTFDVLAWEIELACARCTALDALIGELMQAVPENKRERLLEGMQSVDLLGQHLSGLSAFARRMSAEAPGGGGAPVNEALADITLGALAERMFTALGGVENDTATADAGDLDLF